MNTIRSFAGLKNNFTSTHVSDMGGDSVRFNMSASTYMLVASSTREGELPALTDEYVNAEIYTSAGELRDVLTDVHVQRVAARLLARF